VIIENSKVLVLGGYGLVGTAVCRELLRRSPREIQIHSLRAEEVEKARAELEAEKGETALSGSHGDIFGLLNQQATRREKIYSQLGNLEEGYLKDFLLYDVLKQSKPDIVVDCVNTSTGIAYRDVFGASQKVRRLLEDDALEPEAVEELLEAMYMPRLIRHIQVLYRGMIDVGTEVYVKVGTTGTGGMGLNIPYTHSEERPSRVLLSKSALAGAQSMLLFLMARTPGAPATKEIKPAAAIAWKKIGFGPIHRKGRPLKLVDAHPRPLGERFSTHDPDAAKVLDETLESVFIDTGENGVFSLEEFSTLTTAEQMEFVTPEEIAQYLVFEVEGRSTGYDIMNALDNAVLGPTYRAGMLRHWALERMLALERKHDKYSIAFEMLGPPRITKLLFEAHLLRLSFPNMKAVRTSTPAAVGEALARTVQEKPEVANEFATVGIPVLLANGELIRGPEVLVPARADNLELTDERREAWAHDGWVDLREENCRRWIDRFQAIYEEQGRIPQGDTSSRFLRNREFWEEGGIQPGKVVGWILTEEEKGRRIKR
jgi:hypothetical protein